MFMRKITGKLENVAKQTAYILQSKSHYIKIIVKFIFISLSNLYCTFIFKYNESTIHPIL